MALHDRPAADPRTPGATASGAGSYGHSAAHPDLEGHGSRPGGVALKAPGRAGDVVFRGLATTAAWIIILAVVAIAVFLLALAVPALAKNEANFLFSREWTVTANKLSFGIAGLLWTTVLTSLIAMVLAVPVAIGIALFLTEYAPRFLARPMGFVIDLLAAVPSVIFGLWGLKVLSPVLDPVQTAVQNAMAGVPVLGSILGPGASTGTSLTAGLVLAIMILPIVTSISRDVFAQTPRDHKEAAFALGATRWEMIRTAVLPYGRSGVVSAAMLGLGRALGETVAVMIILTTPSPGSPFNPSLFAGGETFAAKIAKGAAEFDTPTKTGAFVAAGLVLFVLTFLVNAVARVIASRGGVKK